MARCQRLRPNREAMRVELQWLVERGGEQEAAETPAHSAAELSWCESGSLASRAAAGWLACKREQPGLGLA